MVQEVRRIDLDKNLTFHRSETGSLLNDRVDQISYSVFSLVLVSFLFYFATLYSNTEIGERYDY